MTKMYTYYVTIYSVINATALKTNAWFIYRVLNGFRLFEVYFVLCSICGYLLLRKNNIFWTWEAHPYSASVAY